MLLFKEQVSTLLLLRVEGLWATLRPPGGFESSGNTLEGSSLTIRRRTGLAGSGMSVGEPQ